MLLNATNARLTSIRNVHKRPSDGSLHPKDLTMFGIQVQEYTTSRWFADFAEFVPKNLDEIKTIALDTSSYPVCAFDLDDALTFTGFIKSMNIKKSKVKGVDVFITNIVVETIHDTTTHDTALGYLSQKEMDENGKLQYIWTSLDISQVTNKTDVE